MQEQHLFEYAIIRVVPRVEREEFINVGVVLYCARQKYLQAVYELDADRLKALSPALDIPLVAAYLDAFSRICAAEKGAGPIALLPVAERFRWLTATRSTMVQTSKVHPGLCTHAGEMMQRLYTEMVL